MKKGVISRNIGLLMEHFNIRNESQLAKQVGMAQTTINKLIAGSSADPRISTLTPIAEHFNISLNTLLQENPNFDNNVEKDNHDLLIPIIALDELANICDSLESLNIENWPYWYPIPKGENLDYYAIRIFPGQLPFPFEYASLLLIKKNYHFMDNTYCLFKHLNSNSVNIKKVFFENGQKWLVPLKAELPTIIFNEQEWQELGCIQAMLTNMAYSSFTKIGDDKDD